MSEILQSAFDGLREHWSSGDIGELQPLEEGIAALEREKKKLVNPIVDAAERGFPDLYRRLMDKADAIDLRMKGLRNQIALIRLQARLTGLKSGRNCARRRLLVRQVLPG